MLSSVILMFLGFGAFVYHMYFGKIFFPKKQAKTIDSASAFGGYIGGITGPLFALAGFLIVYATIIENREDSNEQKFESIIYKFIDYQRENLKNINLTSPKSCSQIEGSGVWLTFRAILCKSFQLVDSSQYTKNISSADKYKLYYSIFYYGIPKNSKDQSRSLNQLKSTISNVSNLDSLIAQARRIEHCEQKNTYFTGYSNKLEIIYNQFRTAIEYIDHSDAMEFERKKHYVNLFLDQHTPFCLALIKIHSNSLKDSSEFKKLSEKYGIFDRVDAVLLNLSETNV